MSGYTLPKFILIDSYNCRIWYRGEPLICNLCAVQSHKSANCPNKDKCGRGGAAGHFARACKNAWGTNPRVAGPSLSSRVDPAGSAAGSSAGSAAVSSAGASAVSSAGSSVEASGAVEAAVQAQGQSEPAAFVASGGSDLVIEDFSSPSQDLRVESSESFSESQSILQNVVVNDNEISKQITVGNANENSIVNESENGNEITKSSDINIDPDSISSNSDASDVVDSEVPMDLSSSGPVRRSFRTEDLAPFLSKIPRFNPRKLISKVSKPLSVSKTGQGCILDCLWFCLVILAGSECL